MREVERGCGKIAIAVEAQEGKEVGDIPNHSRRAGHSPAPPVSKPAIPENATALIGMRNYVDILSLKPYTYIINYHFGCRN